MPKNRKRAKNSKNKKNPVEKEEIICKEEGTSYAKIIKVLGDCRFSVICDTGEKTAHLRGKMRNRVRIYKDDIVLVTIRDYQDDKVDIYHKYSDAEVQYLLRKKELAKSFNMNDSYIISSDDEENDYIIDEIKYDEKLDDPLYGIDDDLFDEIENES